MFIYEFEKISALLSDRPWSIREKSPEGYDIKYHPIEKRWSCSCPDFKHRKSSVSDDAPFEEKNCKHIRSMMTGKSSGVIRAEDIARKRLANAV